MKKTFLCLLSLSIGLSATISSTENAESSMQEENVVATDSMQVEDTVQAQGSYRKKIEHFLKKHPNASRAGILVLTALEALAVNSKMEFLGIAQANKKFTPSGYVKHNIANACPTIASCLKIPVQQYTSEGPMVKATNIPVLVAVGGLFGQNYYLTKKLYNTDHPAIESFGLTIGGYLFAWAIRLSCGMLNCKW